LIIFVKIFDMQETQNKNGAIGTVITVFFFWGFIAAGNNIFIPYCTNKFDLDPFQGQLIDFAFYFAYYLGALVLYIVGARNGKDILRSWGNKKSIIIGLLLSATGALAMILALNGDVFIGMLLGLFVVGLGFSIQQTAANPLMISLGSPKTGAARVSLGGGINSLGTTIAPLLVGLLLFGTTEQVDKAEKINNLGNFNVTVLYGGVALLFVVLALVFKFSKSVVNDTSTELVEKSNKALTSLLIITGLLITCFVPIFATYASKEAKEITVLSKETNALKKMIKEASVDTDTSTALLMIAENEGQKSLLQKPLEKTRMIWSAIGIFVVIGGLLMTMTKATKEKVSWGALQYPQLVLGMIAIFVYVGIEVAIGSNMPNLLTQKSFGALDETQIAPYIAMYWGSLMIGRWGGAVDAFNLSKNTKLILYAVAPITALVVVLLLTQAAGHNIEPFYYYIICVVIQIAAFIFTKNKTAFTLLIFSLLGALAMLIGINTVGTVSIYAFMSAGLCCSIMWPSIFALAIAGLGKYTSQGSAFLVMMILGGALIPPFQAILSTFINIQNSYYVDFIGFVYLAIFALVAKKVLGQQGINLDEIETSAGH
jgi:MFS transporter, FHS family, L-fucose permease